MEMNIFMRRHWSWRNEARRRLQQYSVAWGAGKLGQTRMYAAKVLDVCYECCMLRLTTF